VKTFRLTRREYIRLLAGLGTLGLLVGLVSGFRAIFEPFTTSPATALLTALGALLVGVAVVMMSTLWRSRAQDGKLALPLALLLVLLSSTTVGGVAVGTYLRTPGSPEAGPTLTTSPTTTMSSTGPTTTTLPPSAFRFVIPGPVPRCSNIEGEGTIPPEGAAVILVRYAGQQPLFYEQPIFFRQDGTWIAYNVVIGDYEVPAGSGFELTAMAVTPTEAKTYLDTYGGRVKEVDPVVGRQITTTPATRLAEAGAC